MPRSDSHLNTELQQTNCNEAELAGCDGDEVPGDVVKENNSSRLRSSLSPEKRGKLAQSLSAARPPSCLCGVTPRQAAKPEKTVEKLPDQLPKQPPEQLPEKLPTVDAEEACNSEKSALVTTDAQLEEQSLEETMIVETAWYEDLAKKDNEQNLAEIVAQDSTVEE